MGEDCTVQEILGHWGNPTPSPLYLTPAALRLNLPRSCLGIVIVKYTFIYGRDPRPRVWGMQCTLLNLHGGLRGQQSFEDCIEASEHKSKQ